MKLKLIFAMTAVLLLSLSSLTFTADEKKAPMEQLKTAAAKLSYALGFELGSSLKEMPTAIDLAVFFRGVEDSFKGNNSLLTPQEAAKVREEFSKKLEEDHAQKVKALAQKNQKEGEAFLAENAKQKGVVTTASGLQYIVLRDGNGPKPKATDKVSVHYRGTLVDGTEFDSSYERNEPVTFQVKGVIAGWTEALQLMKVGSKYRLCIPSNLAYGERGAGPQIGPNATLIFEVELLAIEK